MSVGSLFYVSSRIVDNISGPCLIMSNSYLGLACGKQYQKITISINSIFKISLVYVTFPYNLCYLVNFPYFFLHGMLLLYPRPTKLEGGYTGFTLSVRLSVCPSVRPSVCRRHGFRSISQVCFGISISNFICMLMVDIGRSLLIFSDVTFKMAAWRPYWIFWFPDSNFSLALNINFKP